MRKRPLYEAIAQTLNAHYTCQCSNNYEWEQRHLDSLLTMLKKYMPSGSGFDNGTGLDIDKSTDEKLVFVTCFHHMNEDGYYDGWTDHTVIVKASLAFTLDIRITGPNRNDIKDLIRQEFYHCLMEEIES